MGFLQMTRVLNHIQHEIRRIFEAKTLRLQCDADDNIDLDSNILPDVKLTKNILCVWQLFLSSERKDSYTWPIGTGFFKPGLLKFSFYWRGFNVKSVVRLKNLLPLLSAARQYYFQFPPFSAPSGFKLESSFKRGNVHLFHPKEEEEELIDA